MYSSGLNEEALKKFLSNLPESVTLIGATKTVGVENIIKAYKSGLKNIGENKIQEALDKYPYLKEFDLKWHFIGNLQKNKVKKAVEIFDLIHSVESFKLAEFISKEALLNGKVQNILIQVNISEEVSKGGFIVENIFDELSKINLLKGVMVKGLMTIPPNTDDTGFIRNCFKNLKQLKEEINKKGIFSESLTELSMGMTNDFRIAIEEGSTMIRIGRAIFGDRN